MSTFKEVTPLGCTLRLNRAPDHLGDGVMLSGRMEQPGDGRHFEVYLDGLTAAALGAALLNEAKS